MAAIKKKIERDDFASVFGVGEKRTVLGRELTVRFLSINDLLEVQDRIGGIGEFNESDLGHMKLLLWLIIRKSDPRLTQEQIENEEYLLTEKQIGASLSLRHIKSAEAVEFISYVLIGSGLKEDPNDPGEASSPNAPAAEAAALA